MCVLSVLLLDTNLCKQITSHSFEFSRNYHFVSGFCNIFGISAARSGRIT